jgi:NAD(P)-dependent dehydrogenase (short-subunit alcohol dehydrogenase family)
MKIRNKIALITSGGRGLGRSMALKVAEKRSPVCQVIPLMQQ